MEDRSRVSGSAAGSAVPHLVDIPMRPAPEKVPPPGSTAVWGVVRLIADGSFVPGTLLRLHSVFGSSAVTVTTQAGPDGLRRSDPSRAPLRCSLPAPPWRSGWPKDSRPGCHPIYLRTTPLPRAARCKPEGFACATRAAPADRGGG